MIGAMLKEERERQGLSIEDVVNDTKIRALYIRAIEEGDYKSLPKEVFVKGYVRKYAAFLGLDCNECLEKLKEEIANKIELTAQKNDGMFHSGEEYYKSTEDVFNRHAFLAKVLFFVIVCFGIVWILAE